MLWKMQSWFLSYLCKYASSWLTYSNCKSTCVFHIPVPKWECTTTQIKQAKSTTMGNYRVSLVNQYWQITSFLHKAGLREIPLLQAFVSVGNERWRAYWSRSVKAEKQKNTCTYCWKKMKVNRTITNVENSFSKASALWIMTATKHVTWLCNTVTNGARMLNVSEHSSTPLSHPPFCTHSLTPTRAFTFVK